MSRSESQHYCDLKKLFPFDRKGSQRIPNSFTFIKFQTKILTRLFPKTIELLSQGAAKVVNSGFH